MAKQLDHRKQTENDRIKEAAPDPLEMHERFQRNLERLASTRPKSRQLIDHQVLKETERGIMVRFPSGFCTWLPRKHYYRTEREDGTFYAKVPQWLVKTKDLWNVLEKPYREPVQQSPC